MSSYPGQDAARQAIFEAVAAIAKEAEEQSNAYGAAILRDAAVAYRAAAGGMQPGNVTVPSK